ncbi:hypothetical protein SAMN05880590_11199 [Rhizobium sp. RU35A]|uniref:hypothetical protein n=1 Tax=Rhizobium sp. RU35A TaxID=1907414 RepID=UPI000953D713|nr:hypothetical protein [Rhizobium sp. RU35A]SIR06744.1 hypothetical protein SAMN05880590_11199 [Rhizobium sp. RU35A]
MSRIRSVHPSIWTDEDFMSVSALARLFLIGLWTEAFDDGVFEWKPLTLKARIFPVDNVDVNALLQELCSVGFIARIETHPKKPGVIRNFRKYQRPKKPNSSGMLPDEWLEFTGADGSNPYSDDDQEAPVPHQFGTGGEKSSQMEDGGWRMEEGGEEREEESSSSLRSEQRSSAHGHDYRREFDQEFWPVYPNKVGKPVAFRSFVKARKAASLDVIMNGLKTYVVKTDDRAWCNPSTWLNQERWNDMPASVPRGGSQRSPPNAAPRLGAFQERQEQAKAIFGSLANGGRSEHGDFHDSRSIGPDLDLGREDYRHEPGPFSPGRGR